MDNRDDLCTNHFTPIFKNYNDIMIYYTGFLASMQC